MDYYRVLCEHCMHCSLSVPLLMIFNEVWCASLFQTADKLLPQTDNSLFTAFCSLASDPENGVSGCCDREHTACPTSHSYRVLLADAHSGLSLTLLGGQIAEYLLYNGSMAVAHCNVEWVLPSLWDRGAAFTGFQRLQVHFDNKRIRSK